MKHQPFREALSGQLPLALFSAAWLAIAPAYAAGLETNDPPYQETGKVHNVNLSQDEIFLDDRGFIISPNIIVHSGDKVASKGSLKRGLNIGFNSAVEPAGLHRSIITEIWILPSR